MHEGGGAGYGKDADRKSGGPCCLLCLGLLVRSRDAGHFPEQSFHLLA